MTQILSVPRVTTPDGMVINLYYSEWGLFDRGLTLRWLWNRDRVLTQDDRLWLARNGIKVLGYELVAYPNGDPIAAATDMRLAIRHVLAGKDSSL